MAKKKIAINSQKSCESLMYIATHFSILKLFTNRNVGIQKNTLQCWNKDSQSFKIVNYNFITKS